MTNEARVATKAELENFLGHLTDQLDACGFLRNLPKRPGMVRNIRHLFERGEVTEQELRTLHGIVTELALGRRQLGGGKRANRIPRPDTRRPNDRFLRCNPLFMPCEGRYPRRVTAATKARSWISASARHPAVAARAPMFGRRPDVTSGSLSVPRCFAADQPAAAAPRTSRPRAVSTDRAITHCLAWRVVDPDQVTIHCRFPNRQPWAGGTPRLHHVAIAARTRRHPFKELHDQQIRRQRLRGITHGVLPGWAGSASPIH